MKKKINNFLNSIIINKLLIFLILANLAIFIISTDIKYGQKYSTIIYNFEIISIAIFTIEYFLRIATLKNLKELFKPLMIVDLLAILPFYLSFIYVNTLFLRLLRLSRLTRILKVGRYTEAFENIKQGFINKKEELLITGMIFLSGVIISSTLMYYAEGEINPTSFGSIPRAFWWSIITFTSVSYGDVYPITVIGKIIASITAIIGVGLHGLLIGIIGVAFMNVLNNKTILSDFHNQNIVNYDKSETKL
jgi:voltage-gated potassium channel